MNRNDGFKVGLTFEEVYEIFKFYGLVSYEIKNGECTEYTFKH